MCKAFRLTLACTLGYGNLAGKVSAYRRYSFEAMSMGQQALAPDAAPLRFAAQVKLSSARLNGGGV